MKKVLIISTSYRKGGNSDVLANSFMKGAQSAGHHVEKINISEKHIKYCIGCLHCQKEKKCVLQDDMADILKILKESEVVVFATPIYYYEMCGQMKTFIDRSNPLFDTDYKFRDIYLLASAAENEKSAMDGAIQGLNGWIECYPGTQLKGVIYGTGLTEPSDIQTHSTYMQEALTMGMNI